MNRTNGPEIDRVVKWPTQSLYGEGGNALFARWREEGIASGVRTYGMLSKASVGTRETRQTQAEPVGPNKCSKRGWPDGLSGVGLADSTLSRGEPGTWGSGQRDLNPSEET